MKLQHNWALDKTEYRYYHASSSCIMDAEFDGPDSSFFALPLDCLFSEPLAWVVRCEGSSVVRSLICSFKLESLESNEGKDELK